MRKHESNSHPHIRSFCLNKAAIRPTTPPTPGRVLQWLERSNWCTKSILSSSTLASQPGLSCIAGSSGYASQLCRFLVFPASLPCSLRLYQRRYLEANLFDNFRSHLHNHPLSFLEPKCPKSISNRRQGRIIQLFNHFHQNYNYALTLKSSTSHQKNMEQTNKQTNKQTNQTSKQTANKETNKTQHNKPDKQTNKQTNKTNQTSRESLF